MPALFVSFLQQAVASTGIRVGPLSAYLPEDLVSSLCIDIVYAISFFFGSIKAISRFV